MKQSTLQIRTPEGILFTQPLAGPVHRFLAWIIDALVWMAVVVGVQMVLGLLALISPEVAQGFAILLMFFCGLAYPIFFEWYWRGQTPGKRALRLRVVDAEGLRLQPSQVILRNLLRVVDALPILYAVGGIAMLTTRQQQRLGDLAAGTVVVRIPKVQEPDIDQLVAGRFNSFRAYPHLAARLRQRVSAADASLVVQALMRREEFDPAERVRLFGELAAYFRQLLTFPEEATSGLADEQYLRNVIDLLFRSSASLSTREPRVSNPSPS